MNEQFDEKGKIYTNVIAKVPVPVTIQTLTHRIHGDIYVRPGERLKDELNGSEEFLALTDACVYTDDSKEIFRCHFLTLSIRQIVWLIPDDELNHIDADNPGVNG